MKTQLYNFFVWCAGSDKSILKDCPQFEKIKHAGYGVLVCIPAILAFISMSYAISTLTPKIHWIILAGLAWSLIIFAVDRFIVSTFRKGESRSKDLKSSSFLLRILLASILGIGLSHPFVLLYFDDSITQALNEKLMNDVDSARIKSETLNKHLIESINGEIANSNNLKQPIIQEINAINSVYRDKEALIECKRKLLTAEQSGRPLDLECGSSSNQVGYKGRAINIQNQIDQQVSELAKLKNDEKPQLDLLNNQLSLIDSNLSITINNIQDEIKEADTIKNITIDNIKSNFSNDYLARENALFGHIAKDNGLTVWLTAIAIMLIFFVIDITAVSLKVLVQRGPYDDKMDETSLDYSSIWLRFKTIMIAKGKAEEEFYREKSPQFYEESLTFQEKAKAKEEIVNTIFMQARKFNTKSYDEHIDFLKFYSSNLSRIAQIKNDDETKAEELNMIKDLKRIFYETSKKARDEYKNTP